ncbi:PilZ domain-containing protein [Alkalicoccobacillus porphyridii]|uniref:PilZ domain-containing protein n=1 Tax=Alkalicoccobacillus porphyridii TaxID=2597270 RepID=UPI00163DC090|nr:PilZ domain-containing protein [Alkalicoccobacillus porphyridii]
MRYNRDESFRYEFRPVLEGSFLIHTVNQKEVQASNGKLSIINLSPKGIGIETQYDFPDPVNYTITLQISCTIDEATLTFLGNILWKKTTSKGFGYGLELLTDEASQKEIISQLKKHALKQSST